ncbi:hypothetical protein ACLFMI_21040 [Pseudonocardia nantongensis]
MLLALVHRVVVVLRTAERDELAESETAHEDTLARDQQHDTREAA